jgi:hypothetical protein
MVTLLDEVDVRFQLGPDVALGMIRSFVLPDDTQ